MDVEDGTKAAIIEASIKLFYNKGYRGTSMPDIASECDITPAAIYYHFKNKEQVLWSCYENLIKELDERVIKEVNKFTDPKAKLERFIEIVFNIWFDRPELSLLQAGPIADLSAKRTFQYKVHRANWFKFIHDLIAELGGSFRSDEELRFSSLILSKSLSYPETLIGEFGYDHEDVSEDVKKNILVMLKKFYVQALTGERFPA
ncbi:MULTISPECIES: TetR/AcrR family transcriptional regulator [unclassified Sphingomonas]|uniref:TetR/AcrR family transcriptional regulator n=1 Tax=unclassified Sphingomonas TaxID=196159 RepID=UPI000701E896|nr:MULTISPECIES: TetR/AcrR family transcriptional regulator [unclassified Sphingomonas]KQX23434.1 TetR family transcriptional regulator [Sphingomonas sp. Root1294]KQY68285.1 TetR family transcriptional regulator [Sphingomonas sp. Root50]KRB91185.1 TetR family transcriptional regulator [Sphingomonas sp. Root720]